MPELPEVETVVRALRPKVVGRTIEKVRVNWARHIATPDVPVFEAHLQNVKIEALTRRAKYIVFKLDSGETMLVHLKMTGHLSVVAAERPVGKYDHTVFELDGDEELRFRDPRKFGKVHLLDDPEVVLGKLGPEPLLDDFTVAVFKERLEGRSRQLKPLLLDQTFIAGVGNIYADEALHHAHLHPLRRANSLSEVDIVNLHEAVRHVLRLGIAREGASIDQYVKPDGSKGDMQNAVAVFRRTGHPCYTCGTPISRIVVGGRSTHFCSQCQSAPE
ncbi:MAG TPA: bifunctional DNA-formamidopyrimidine glycosylase/DNA-(apurinic or apyrimidinic site) lyase [Anaerolineae bacterium]|nr:bifunctional DNA-formamidopyrimidine glycosylase/DNA-(apurinic or apyrimidinic site) lyase [Anaerolineae bacterium]